MKNLLIQTITLLTLMLCGDMAESAAENCLCLQGACPMYWYQYKDSCYRPVMIQMSWPDAEIYCQNKFQGAHLASVHSLEENNFIFVLMGRLSDYAKKEAYWIGAHDFFKEGLFAWTDGTEMDYQIFGPNQPDNAREGESYVGTWSVEDGTVTWNDYPYNPIYFFPFVCKSKISH
ncbi:snaclec rhodocetin subunit delta-like [Protopterus annectens]|uniref:snaclec rhodocetin subunit delta-like n=1 Tax=Protopterus annectens TaxID=7888 RepID=UPI001CF9955B|nr:snaclec rhodocetin subunit delta-like [Protopterus annectens]